ncbi:MAG: two-component system response regulator [Spirochaetes bacterium RBG_16_49_21]|nr:MAG: two-component system response regulator [Spirochaetes bacterium RBG_16_49_21]
MDTNVIDILLVEDNSSDVELTLRAFKKHNIINPIHVVSDGAEALEFLFANGRYAGRRESRNPKVILLDLKLPKVNGLEVLKKIKEDESTRLIPVVVLTSSREEQDIIQSYKLGVNSFIVKPVDFEKFIDAVRNLGMYWLLMNQPPF